MKYSILGIDQSLTGTGICVIQLDGNKETIHHQKIKTGKLRGAKRLFHISSIIRDIVKKWKVDLALLEGYSYRSFNHAFALGEVGGVVRCLLQETVPSFYVVPPKSLKKFVTGNGGAEKEEVMATYGLDDGDIADARGLAEIGRHLHTMAPGTRSKAEVLKTVKANPENLKKRKQKKKRPKISKPINV